MKYSLFSGKINTVRRIPAFLMLLKNVPHQNLGDVEYMNEYNDFEFKSTQQNGEPDYYAMYVNEKTSEARRVFSRYHLSLFLFTVISYAVIIAAEIFLALFLGEDGFNRLLNNAYAPLIFNVVSMYLIAFPIFVLLIKNMKIEKREKKKMSAGEFLSLLLIGEALMFIGNVIGQFLNSIIGIFIGNDVTNSIDELINNSPIWLVFLVTVIIAPIIEELMFRKFMIDRLSRYGDLLAVIISSIGFGLFHGNFYQFFYAAMLGFILGYIYTKTRNVKYSILMHMIINFMGSVAVLPLIDILDEFYEMSAIFEEGGQIDYAAFIKNTFAIASYSIIQYSIYIAGAAILIIYLKKRLFKFEKKCEYSLPKERRLGIVILNVGVILFLISSIAIFGLNILSEVLVKP